MTNGQNKVRQGVLQSGKEVRKLTVVKTDHTCLSLTLLFASYVALGKLLNLSEPHTFHLSNGDNNHPKMCLRIK